MPRNLAIFEKLVYSSCAVDFIAAVIFFRGGQDLAFAFLGSGFGAVLAYLAARRSAAWAGWLIVALAIIAVVAVVAPLFGPSAMSRVFFAEKPGKIEIAMEVVSTLCLVAASYFFVTRNRAETV